MMPHDSVGQANVGSSLLFSETPSGRCSSRSLQHDALPLGHITTITRLVGPLFHVRSRKEGEGILIRVDDTLEKGRMGRVS